MGKSDERKTRFNSLRAPCSEGGEIRRGATCGALQQARRGPASLPMGVGSDRESSCPGDVGGARPAGRGRARATAGCRSAGRCNGPSRRWPDVRKLAGDRGTGGGPADGRRLQEAAQQSQGRAAPLVPHLSIGRSDRQRQTHGAHRRGRTAQRLERQDHRQQHQRRRGPLPVRHRAGRRRLAAW